MTDNRGFWESWAKRYDRFMASDRKIYGKLGRQNEAYAESNYDCTGAGLRNGAFVGTACRKCEAAGGNGLFCGDDKTGEVKAALIPSKFLSAGRNKSSICCGNLRRGNHLKRFTYYAAP